MATSDYEITIKYAKGECDGILQGLKWEDVAAQVFGSRCPVRVHCPKICLKVKHLKVNESFGSQRFPQGNATAVNSMLSCTLYEVNRKSMVAL